MAVSPESLADEIVQRMRRYNRDALTILWPDFYVLCQRDRLRQGFLDALAARLASSSVLMAQGNAAVVFAKDYDFAPYKDAEGEA